MSEPIAGLVAVTRWPFYGATRSEYFTPGAGKAGALCLLLRGDRGSHSRTGCEEEVSGGNQRRMGGNGGCFFPFSCSQRVRNCLKREACIKRASGRWKCVSQQHIQPIFIFRYFNGLPS